MVTQQQCPLDYMTMQTTANFKKAQKDPVNSCESFRYGNYLLGSLEDFVLGLWELAQTVSELNYNSNTQEVEARGL